MTAAAKPLVIIGGGEHARVVIECARSQGDWSVRGYSDRAPVARTDALHAPFLGDDDVVIGAHADAWFVLGVGGVGGLGALAPRRRAEERHSRAGIRWATVVHTRAWVSPSAQLGAGVVVMAGAIVGAGTRVGPHCIINSGAIVDHDVELGQHTHVGAGAVIAGGVRVGEEVTLGAGSCVRDHVSIGPGSVVGMAAAIIRDVDAHQVVIGVPGRRMHV